MLNNLKRRAMTLLLSLAMIITYMPLSMITAYAAAGDVPAHDKILTVNDDGTYTLALNVTGDSEKQIQKVNVIVIVDRSGSMDTQSGTGAYVPTNGTGTGLYGLIDGQYVPLTRQGGPGNRTFWYNGVQYTGQRYQYDSTATRMQATQAAVNGLAETLLEYNGKDGNPNDTVQMALVSFATTSQTNVTPTTSYSTFSTAVNGLNANGGTNWESALDRAGDINFGDSDTTFVIFFSDGSPTFHSTDGGYNNWNNQYNVYGSGQEQEPNMERSYTQAVDDASSLASKVGTDRFYTIFAYGTTAGATYMTNLTTAAGAPAANNYSASNTAELNDAFAEILESIEMAGIGNVDITDGTTSNVTTSTGTAHLLDVDTTSYKYYRAGGDDGNGGEIYDSDANSGLGEEWADAPAATFENGNVKWDLGDNFILEDGVTYTVTFDCWPSQETLDHVASIKNDPTYYSKLDPAIRQYLDENGDLKTNTTATLNYTDTRTGESGSPTYVNPEPVTTTAVEQLAVSKEWHNELEDEWDKPESITLDVTRDGTNTYTATLSDDNDWKDGVYISIGIMRTSGEGASEEVELLTTGHNFTFDEPGAASGYKWELDVPVVRPMKINGTDTILVLVDENHPAPSGAKTYTLPDKDGVKGGTYYVSDLETVGLTATNERRSSLNIRKVVDGEDAPKDATFPFTINVENALAPETAPADDPNHDSDYWVWISVRDMSETDDPDQAPPVTDAVVSGATHAGGGWYYGESGKDIVLNVKDGYSIRLNNLPVDSKYTVTEGDLPTGFSFEDGEIAIADGSGTKTDSFTVDKSAKKVSGTIEETNTLYQVTMTNQYALTDLEITKEWVDGSDQDGIRPTAAEFAELLTLSPAVDGATPTVVDNGDNTFTITYTDLPRFNNGQEVTYTVAEGAIEGYTPSGSPAEDHGTITNTHTPEVVTISGTKTWDDSKYSTGDAATIGNKNEYTRPSSITINLLADGVQKESKTVTEADNWAWSFTNLPKYKDGKEIVYTVTETTPDGYTSEVTGYDVKNTPVEAEEVGEVEMTLKKTDANTGNTIDGAVFTLTGPSGAESESTDITVNGTATIKFTKPGTYTLVEKTAPTGYESVTTEYTIVVDKDLDSIKLKESVWTWIYNLVFSDETKATFDKDTTTLTVPNPPTTTSVEATKEWDDNNNQDGKRDNVTFVLKAGGEAVDGQEEKTISKTATGDALKVKWENLPAYEDGTKIEYTVEEKGATGGKITMNGAEYTVTVTGDAENGFTIKNSYSPEKTSVQATKEWDDNNDQDGKRDDVTFILLADGEEVDGSEKTIAADATGDDLTVSWTDLPVYADGEEITYTVEEVGVEDGKIDMNGAEYTVTVTGDAATGFTIKNSHTPEVVTVEGQKIWEDDQYFEGEAAEIGDDNEYERPDVTITLTGSDDNTYTVTLDGTADTAPTGTDPAGYESGAWAYTFVNLPKYADGEEIEYTVDEADLAGFTGVVDGNNVTNTPDEAEEVGEIEMTLKKTDANTGNTIDGAVFTLTGPSGEESTSTDITVNGTATIKFTKPGTYTLVEKTAPTGYQPVTTSYTIVVNKELDSITLKESVWTWIYNLVFGDETKATFDENTTTLTVPNPPETVEVEATKEWDDNDNQDGKRADVVFQLYKNNSLVADSDKTIAKDATGAALTVKWEDLPAYEDGAEITYTVKEKDVENGKITMNGAEYTVTVTGDAENGFTIKNSYSPEKTTVTVNKVWVGDEEWKETVRPDSITLNLKADGQAAVDADGAAVAAATVTPDESGNWTYTFTNLPKNKNGTAIVYTVEEEDVAGYTTTYSDDTFTITNTYEPTPTTAEFDVKKVLTVPEGLDGPAEWSYDITASANGTAPAPEEATQTVTNDSDTATFTFAEDAFIKPGTYTYTITEEGEIDGVTNDPSGSKTVTITVAGDKEGNLTATVSPDTQGIAATFNNTYSAKPVSVDPPVQKVIENNDDLYNGGDFTFTIENTAAPEGVTAPPMPAKTSIKNQASDEFEGRTGFYEFGVITFTAPGTYTYAVTESGSAPGVTNDSEATKELTFTVTDDGEGNLEVTPTTDEATFVFTNVYSAEGSATLQATKAVSGREWKDSDSFTFELIDATGATVDTQTATSANKTVTFDEIEYTLDDVGTHTYTITETGTLPAGMTKSADITATVTVTDNGEGELETSVSYTNNDTITNTYVPAPTEATIDVNKSIEGYLSDDSGSADATFKFELFDESGAKIDETSITTENGEGTASFEKIDYTEAGTYTYTVKETAETKAGFTYDVSTYTVTVEVTDNTDEGKLEAEISYKRDDADATEITFENEFKMKSVTVDLKLYKEIEDQSDSAHDSTFKFTLKDSEGTVVDTKTITTSNLKGSTTFEDLEFTKAGEYTYTVVEEDTGEAGFTYDTTEHTYKIIVKNNFDVAVLEVDDEGSTLEATVTNIYKAADTSIVLKAEKEVNDTSGSAYDTEFTFTLKDKDGKTIDEKSITGPGTVEFESIPYEKAGTYKYTIQETAGDAKGYIYDTKEYEVTVKVVDENGQLVATAKYDTASGEGSTDLTITNTYDPDDAKIILEARKMIEDKTGGATAKTFKFELLDKDGKVIETVTRTGGGPVTFSEITYSKVGTYNYTIHEVAGTDAGYTYDTADYPVTVEVTDDGGVLTAEVTEGNEIVITNTYEAEPVTIPIEAKKVLEGRKLKNGEFTFQLLEDGEVIAETTNKADGSIAFDEITYEEPGTHNYTIVEVAGDDETVKYDTNQYPVTVTVTDDGEGQLEVTVSGVPVFTNTVENPPEGPGTGDNGFGFELTMLFGSAAAFLAMLAARRRKRA